MKVWSIRTDCGILTSMKSHIKRDLEIVRLRRAGLGYGFIADSYGITRQRAQQIYVATSSGVKIYVKQPTIQTRPRRIAVRVAHTRVMKKLSEDEYRQLVKRASPFRSTLSGRDFARELIRVRDNHTCQMCGKQWKNGSRRLDIHHLNGLCGKMSVRYESPKDTMHYQITLCHKCHYNHPQHSLWGGTKNLSTPCE